MHCSVHLKSEIKIICYDITLFYNVLQSDLFALNQLPSCGSFAAVKSVNCISFQCVPVVNYFPLSRYFFRDENR